MADDEAVIDRDCVIAGGGPAGMVLGYVLARAGLRVTVLEKHLDFFRDFRGDTIHPSTIGTLTELGLREAFLALPLTRLETMDVVLDGVRMTLVDFRRLPAPNDFLVFAPQWDFLSFLATEGAKLPGFDLRMGTEAVELITEIPDEVVTGATDSTRGDPRIAGKGAVERDRVVTGVATDGARGETPTAGTGTGEGVVTGVVARTAEGELRFRAPLTVAADGRHSTLRPAAGLVPDEFGVPIDVLWFSLPIPPDPPPHTLIYLTADGAVLTLPRRDHYQAGTIIEKGGFDALKSAGLDTLRARIAAICPALAPVVDTLTDWSQVKLLSVQLDRLSTWHRPGFVAIGDAAHAMSPIGGVGVNYAIQDAIALANALVPPGATDPFSAPDAALAAFQRRRETPVRRMQSIQRRAHGLVSKGAAGRLAPRWTFRLLRAASPLLRGRLARFIGLGLRPEHFESG